MLRWRISAALFDFLCLNVIASIYALQYEKRRVCSLIVQMN